MGSLVSVTCPGIDSECDRRGVCDYVREKRERVDEGMRERGSVCEGERGRVLPAQSDQCFSLLLAMWITAHTAYWIAIPITGNLH